MTLESKDTSKEYVVPHPDWSRFRSQGSPIKSIAKEWNYVYEIERIEYPASGGVFTYYKELLYPRTGYVFREAIVAINSVKRTMRVFVRALVEMPWTVAGLALLPWRWRLPKLQLMLEEVGSLLYMQSKHVMCQERKDWKPAADEFGSIIENILINVGIHEHTSAIWSDICRVIIEYDRAYCSRLQDVASAVNLKDHRSILKMLRVLLMRESNDLTKSKMKYFPRLLHVLFLSRRIRKAVDKAISECDQKRLRLTQADWYHLLFPSRYKFLGLDNTARQAELLRLHNGMIPLGVVVDI